MKTEKKYTIAITGADGVLGKACVSLLEKNLYKVLVLHHNMEEIEKALKENQKNIKALVHCAFARNEEPRQLAESLLVTRDLMCLANQLGIPRIIHISSKSVYEGNAEFEWDESTLIDPKGSYALAKYASELIADAGIVNPNCKLTHIRLASLIGPGMEQRVVTKLIRMVLAGQDITITNGALKFQYMDIRDAAEAIMALLKTDKDIWKKVYCVAPHTQVSLQNIAETVVKVCMEEGSPPVNITLLDSVGANGGYMNPEIFCNDTKWTEKYLLKDCVRYIFQQCKGEG